MTAVSEVREPGLEELAKRVDDAVSKLAELDPKSRAVAEELKAALEAVDAHLQGGPPASPATAATPAPR